ncbi:MAG: PEP-CTERM sorting domain-containing protein [Phycisphaerae bacterium]
MPADAVITDADWSTLAAVVPEPNMALLLLAGSGLIRRRRS